MCIRDSLYLAVSPSDFCRITLFLRTLAFCLPALAMFFHDAALERGLRIDPQLCLTVRQMHLCLLQAHIGHLAGTRCV